MSVFGNSLHVLNRFSHVWLLVTLWGIFRTYNCGMPQVSPVKQEWKLLQRRESWEELLEPEGPSKETGVWNIVALSLAGLLPGKNKKISPPSGGSSVASAGETGFLSSFGDPVIGVWELPLVAFQLHFRAVQSLRRVWLWDPTECSTPGFPTLHHLPELAQTHVHWVGDAIQPSSSVVPFSSCPQSFHFSEVYLY